MDFYLILGALAVPVVILAAVIARRGGRMGEYDANGRGVSSPHVPRTGGGTTNGTGWGGSVSAGTYGAGVAHPAEDWGGRDLRGHPML